ncbi:MAG: hypothetical protein M1834_002075 [Cirrosporium novae-zelandiae]|nr:MAG: hypothetical protein M1834_002075 [Cirrosporium novae-zelandiae]
MAEMEGAERSSIYVAPLNIKKYKAQGSQSLSRTSSVVSRRRNKTSVASQTQMTPPLSPRSSQETIASEEEEDQIQPVFHTYLRAFYPFHPPISVSSTTITVPLCQGDIVLVHSIHTNGWADGTILSTGGRGWLPTNYCEPFDPGAMTTLFHALTTFWDQVRDWTENNLDRIGNQDYMRGIIAGIRVLLERTGCLNRDSPNVQTHNGLKRNRKVLLSDLSALVRTSKSLQDVIAGKQTDLPVADILDEMLLRAFKLVMRGVRFLDIWKSEFKSGNIDNNSTQLESGRAVPPTPPAETVAAGSTSASTEPGNPGPNLKLASHKLINDADAANESGTTQQTEVPSIQQESTCEAGDDNANPIESRSTLSAHRPSEIQTRRISVTHRLSYNGQTLGSRNPNLASERLSASHDAFLGCLGSFIGLHLQARSTSELLVITQQSVTSCRSLLNVVEAVLDHDVRRSEILEQARDAMYKKITDLVHTAQEIFRPAMATNEEDVLLPDEGKELVAAATGCVRTAGECVAKTRYVLERIGDFEFESLGLGIFDVDNLESGNPAQEPAENPATSQEIDEKPLPPPPQSPTSPIVTENTSDPSEPKGRSSSVESFLPPLPQFGMSPLMQGEASDSSPETSTPSISIGIRKSESGVASTISNSTYIGSIRDSETSALSRASTRAASPDNSPPKASECERFSSTPSTLAEECEDAEAKVLEKTYAHELVYNKDGQITGGSLPALIEKLTTHDSTPDALFVSTFYLTFRLFATPMGFAEALVDRFDYVGDSENIAMPVRLRVYNVFKGWLETHWRHDCDSVALDFIMEFAKQKLNPVLPGAGVRLRELGGKVAVATSPVVPRLVSSIGKTNTSVATYISPETPLPPPMISKGQLNALRSWKNGGAPIGILDFDPLELARQFTLKESRIFCSILPEELLATEWMKKSGSLAVNVRAMSTLSTDLANLVADSILMLEDVKKRARIIKQWVKIAARCLELNNYDSLMAIVCSLNSSTIIRMKLTWEIVSQKTKATWDLLKSIVDVSRNYAVLRQRLHNSVPPCIPFVGTYLTDLTFVEEGNQTTRQLYSQGSEQSIAVINFDKHVRTAKIISELQRFQIPYRIAEVPELQTWIQDQLVRVRSSDPKDVQHYYRRSLLLEPREQITARLSPLEPQQQHSAFGISRENVREKFDFLNWSHLSREKSLSTSS